MIYVSIDSNNTGKIIERLILDNKSEDLKLFSFDLSKTIVELKDLIESLGGSVLIAGGDNILATVSSESINTIVSNVRDRNIRNNPQEYKFSIGMGKSMCESYLALKYAKANSCFAVKKHLEAYLIIDSDFQGLYNEEKEAGL